MTTANINVRRILLKRGTTAASEQYVGLAGEVTIDTDLDALRVHDGTTPGGTLMPSATVVNALNDTIANANASLNEVNVSLVENSSLIGNLQTSFDSLETVAFTGNYQDLYNVPTTISNFENDADYANVSYVDTSIANLINSAPGALDTLNELAAALGNNANFATTVTDSLATKLNTSDFANTASAWLSTKTTSNIAEGSNLYYTTTRANADFDTRLANRNTTYLAEGVNLYYTNARVQTKLADVSGNIIPRTDSTYNLGDSTHRFKDLFLSGTTVYLGNVQLKEVDGQFKVLDSFGQITSSEMSNLTVQGVTGQSGLLLTTSGTNANEQILLSPAAINDESTYVTIDSTDLNITSNAYFTGTINSSNDIITSGNITANKLTGDLTGSVYSSSGTLMIDASTAKVTGFVENLSVDTALLNVDTITVKTGGSINLNNEDIAQVGNINVVQVNASEVNSGSVATGQVSIDDSGVDLGATGVLSGPVEGQLTGNVYSQASDLLVNATAGTIVGPVETSYVNAGSIGADIYGAKTIGNFINLGVNASSINVTTGIDMLANNITNANVISATTFVGNISGQVSDIGNHSTTELTEGTNLYYTSSRVRNELQVNDTGGDGSLSYDTATGIFTFAGPSASETRSHFSVNDTGGDGSLSYDSNTGVFTYAGPDATEVRAHFVGGTGIDIVDGVISISQPVGANDAVQFDTVVAEVFGNVVGNVTGQVSDISNHTTDELAEGSVNLYYLDSRARDSISVVNLSGDGEIEYNANTGVVSYTGPSAANVRAHLSAGTGVTYSSSGEFSIGQDVSTTADVQFHDVTVQGNLFVQGNTTVVDSTNTSVSDNIIVLNNGEPGSAVTAGSAGIEIDRGSAGNVSFLFRESDGNWTTGSQGIVTEDNFYGNLVGSVFSANSEIMVNAENNTLHADNVNAIAFNGSLFTNGGPGRGPLQIMAGGVNESGHTIFINPYGTDTYLNMKAESIILTTGPYTEGSFGQYYPRIVFTTEGAFEAIDNAYFKGSLTGSVNGDITGNVTGQVSDISNHTTDAISEGTFNLYYDDIRVDNRVDVHLSGGTGVTYNAGEISIGQDVSTSSSVQFGSIQATLTYSDLVGNVTGQVSDITNHTTDAISEGTFNLYYDDIRVDNRVDVHLSGGTGVTYNAGEISIGQDVSTSSSVQFGSIQATLTYSDLVGNVTGQVSDITNHTTDSLPEGTFNLYYDDLRVDTRVNNYLNGGTGVTYSNGTISIGQDVATSADVTFGNVIATNIYGDVTGQVTSIANHSTDDLTEGNVNLYYTDARVDARVGNLNAQLTTTDITEGSVNLYYTDDRVQTKLGNISGHLIPDTDVSYDLGSSTHKFRDLYLSGNSITLGTIKLTDSNTAFEVTDIGGNVIPFAFGSNNTDDITEGSTNLYYTDARAQAAITGGTGVTVSSGEVSIGQDVSTTANVTFSKVTTTGDVVIQGQLTVSGTTTTINTETINLADNIILLNSNETAAPTQSAGLAINRGTEATKFMLWDEVNGYWTVNDDSLKANVFIGNLSGDLTGIIRDTAGNVVLVPGSGGNANYIGNVSGDVTGQVSDISNHTTTDLTEGTNLYYTQARFDSAFGAKTTSDLTEGTNQYYTDAKARAAISAGTNLEYSSSTGQIDLGTNVLTTTAGGTTGQIPYVSAQGTSEVVYDYMLRSGDFVETATELTDAQNRIIPFSTVFNSWYRFSHNTTLTFPANASELTAWSYDAVNDYVVCTTNSSTYIGFVSSDVYENYLHEVKISSTDSDDDAITVVIAWYIDPVTGYEYTLSAHRDAKGGTNFSGKGWEIVYNYNQGDAWRLYSEDGNQPTTGWAGKYTKVKIERTGDIIVCDATEFDTDTYGDLSTFTVDLSSDPRLEKFRGPSAYGYGAYSQGSATFEVLRFEDPSQSIYDLRDGTYYLKVSGSWVAQGENIWESVGVGKFLINQNTGKMFFIDSPTTIKRIGNFAFINDDTNTVNVPALELDGYATGSLPAVAEGTIVFDSDTKQFKGFNGTSWVVLG